MDRRALLVLVPLLLPACAAGAPPGEPAGVRALGAAAVAQDAGDGEVRALARAQLALALDVYAAVAAGDDGDLVLGPTSLHTALLLVRAGAAGRTADEMDAVLHPTGVVAPLRTAGALDAELRERAGTDGVELTTARRAWVDPSLELLAPYVEQVTSAFEASLAEVDLAGDPEAARATINRWVASATRDRVEELMPAGSVDAATRMVLTDALALDAAWRFPFDPRSTRAAPFHLSDGSVRQVPTMQYEEYLPSGRGPGWVAVRLPYTGDELSMTVVVPDDLATFERRLSPALLDEVDAGITDGGIHLSLPRFTARSALDLVGTLAALGMPSAFGGGADFSGMSREPLFIAAVEHSAVVTVDEDGTEAAAATGVAMAGSHGPTVTVDRPFLFVVRDDATGAVLFLGRVTDPR
jgi:serpin B